MNMGLQYGRRDRKIIKNSLEKPLAIRLVVPFFELLNLAYRHLVGLLGLGLGRKQGHFQTGRTGIEERNCIHTSF